MSEGPVQISSKEQFDDIRKSSKLLVVAFFAVGCAPCRRFAPTYQTLAQTASRPSILTFASVDVERAEPLAKEYLITALPTILLFQEDKLIQSVEGAKASDIKQIILNMYAEYLSIHRGRPSTPISGSGSWVGAEIPRGYSDISDQVEIGNCELSNADEGAGTVKVLFDVTKPSALSGDDSDAANDYVQSGADDQLLLFIPFQGTVKLHTLQVGRDKNRSRLRAKTNGSTQVTSLPPKDQDDVSRPEVIQLYINRPQHMDFSEADDTEPTQAITLTPEDWNTQGTASINLRFVKFQKTTTLIIYVQRGEEGADAVRLDRIKLIGEAGTKREMGKLQKVGDDE
ncbi:Thioredoxin [Metarhizium album ARSEF 1941]|uniref:Thioredoxin n=1 Tax=Metarhizium album (strain ARSEF 1941) TaxID=1081103 RepID=A0A0B2WPE6_METAS|nr:Thioredoxin [Metarhizium album ARSEF 1941]KHN95342.1 Thioredoxin [Metarhizium album ARSEF 1941]